MAAIVDKKGKNMLYCKKRKGRLLHDGNTLAADRAVQKVCDYFFVTILLVAMGITILLLDFSSDKFVTYELNQMETTIIS